MLVCSPCGCGSREKLSSANRAVLTPSIWSLIASRWAFSVRLWGLLTLLTLLPAIVPTGTLNQVSLLRAILAEIVGAIVMGIVFVIADRRISQAISGRSSSAWIVLAIWVLAFVLRFFAFGLVVGPSSREAVIELLARLLGSIVALVVWAGLITYYLSLGDYYRGIASELTISTTRLRELSRVQLNDLGDLRDQLAASVEYSIQPVLRGLEEQLSTLNDSSTQSELLALAEMAGDHSRKLVRDVSHQISERQEPLETKVLAEEDPRPPNRRGVPWRISVTWAPAIFVASILPPATGYGLAVVGRIATGVVTWIAVMLLFRWAYSFFVERLRLYSLVYVVAANVLAEAVGFAVAVFVYRFSSTTAAPANGGLVAILALGATGFLAGVLPSALDRSISTLRRDSELLRGQNIEIAQLTRWLEKSTSRLRQQVAEILHGPVQGRLSGVAMSLRLFVESQARGDVSGAAEVVQRCRGLLEQVNRDIDLVLAGKFESGEPVSQRLHLLQERWAGIIEVRWEIGPSAAATLEMYGAMSQQVSSILEEGINNACSHGRARVVDISVRIAEHGDLQIQFVDDGQGPTESIEAGMGFREIEAGGGSWRLDRLGASGARLLVTLPLRLSAASAAGV